MSALVDVAQVLGGLKDFQRATVEHAYERLFDAPDSTRRFLVADEVGLGKTLVARGVVAKAIERLDADGVERIDVVYICSNADIAAQNVRKLDVAGIGAAIVSRLTLLAKQVKDLESRRLNIVALTPGTSFERGSATGRAEERVLLHALLTKTWALPDTAGPKNVLQATTRKASTFRQHIRDFDRSGINPGVARAFAVALEARAHEARDAGGRTIRERFDELCREFARSRKHVAPDLASARRELIAELRGLLAAACIEVLEPDLVILDEFQRFKHLLEDDGTEAASLARSLFTWRSPEREEHVRLLLLSATPYRALTVAGDGGDDDHHEDFLSTVRFLFDDSQRSDDLRELLRGYQRELYGTAPGHSDGLRAIGEDIARLLGKVIARTERIGAAGQQDAMLHSIVRTSSPTVDDLRQFVLVQDVAKQLGQPDVTELWKSAPFLLNFLDGYQLRSRFDAACKIPASAREIAALLEGREELLIGRERIAGYEEIDPGGPRIRELARDVIDTEAWRLLWIPPAMPYHRLGGPYASEQLEGFSKRLVFSAWRAVPRAAAGLLSYLAERRLTLEADANARNTTERRSSQRNRLAFTVGPNRRLTGMPALTLLYPSPALAEAADPRQLATVQPDADIPALIEWARGRVQPLLERLPAGPSGGDIDERWYWAAPLLLDGPESSEWWSQAHLATDWAADDPRATAEGSHWVEHVELAANVAAGTIDPPLGRRPEDLEEVVVRLAVGAPGTLALRSLSRVAGLPLHVTEARNCAARVAWALRGLFNSPEATALLRATRTETFWRQVLQHSVEGDLQAVLDEHAHVLFESEGLQYASADKAARGIAKAMARSLGLRSASVIYTALDAGNQTVETKSERLHTAFAMRFGDAEGGSSASDEGQARPSQLREAFNSPYWPFVLVSTAVGQEGLDFHPYCHVVVHWNLPTNPVDLEQREGRVHRFKGHAIRKNVAQVHRADALASPGDPWRAAFELAAADRLPADSELVPYWIYPLDDGAAVERHVLALPMSRELDRLDRLRDSLAVYRLAFGQARQEDVIDHLLSRLGPDLAAQLARELRIDLRPPVPAEG